MQGTILSITSYENKISYNKANNDKYKSIASVAFEN